MAEEQIEKIIECLNYDDPTERWLITDNEVRAMAKLAIIGHRAMQEPSLAMVEAAQKSLWNYPFSGPDKPEIRKAIAAALEELRKETQ